MENEFYAKWLMEPDNLQSLTNTLRYHVICPADMQIRVRYEAENGEQEEKRTTKEERPFAKADMMNSLEMNNIEEIKTLNPYQQEAVLDESPACLVNANVGSGKTTVLIEKVRHLHEKKQVSYEKMAVLTFTNKAADEIAERLSRKEAELTEEELWGFGTFHSVALRILRRFLPEKAEDGTKLEEWNREFTVITPEDEMEMVLAIAKKAVIRSNTRTV